MHTISLGSEGEGAPLDGASVAPSVGSSDGLGVGTAVGQSVGACDGQSVGSAVGVGVGSGPVYSYGLYSYGRRLLWSRIQLWPI